MRTWHWCCVLLTPPWRYPDHRRLTNFELANDFVFFGDMLLNFRTAYIDTQGNVVKEPAKITRKYIAFWFWIDLAASIPFDLREQMRRARCGALAAAAWPLVATRRSHMQGQRRLCLACVQWPRAWGSTSARTSRS